MRVLIGAAALCLMLAAPAVYAQAPAPAQPPAAQAAPPVQRPFPTGTKYAFINIQRIAAESAEGRSLSGKVQQLNQQKVNELNEKNKALQGAQQKFESGATVMSDNARAQLQKEIERLQIDIQRFTEDAQQEVQTFQGQLQEEFQRKLSPVVQQIAVDKGLHMLFSVVDSGLVWADPALDITGEVIQKFDASAPAAAAAPAPRPAAPAAPATPAPKPPAKP